MKFELRYLLLVAGTLLLTGCEKPTLPEGGFAAKAVLSADELNVGDVVTLTITARHAPGSTVQFPAIAGRLRAPRRSLALASGRQASDAGNRKGVIVRGRSTETSTPAESVLETEEIIRLTSLRTGNWLITTNPVVCTFSDGTQKTQALPPLTLKVVSTLDENNAAKLSDIKGPIRNLRMIFLVIALIIAVALIAGLATLLFMRKPKGSAEPVPIIPPHIKARNALAALKEIPWMPEPFFVDLSLILRTYLEDRFDLNAPESTTEELAAKLNHDARLTLKDQNTLREFFVQADLVKFARAGAEKDVMRTAFETVTQFVEQTCQTSPTSQTEKI